MSWRSSSGIAWTISMPPPPTATSATPSRRTPSRRPRRPTCVPRGARPLSPRARETATMSETDLAGVAIDDEPARGAIGELRVVDRLRRGDRDAERDLVERYGARAYRVAIGITRNAADAEAVAQDALGS